MKGLYEKISNLHCDFHKIVIAYFCIYILVMGLYCGVYGTLKIGEFDDYSLTAVSLMTEHNIGISSYDIQVWKQIFPEWANSEGLIRMSTLHTKGGQELAWYFPTYSATCIPMIKLLQFLRLPAVYAFVYTNFILLIVSLVIVYKCLKVDELSKFILVLLLSINPIVFYLSWPSAEVFIYAMLVITMVSWYNGWYKRAALAVSMAGMLNPTIMSIGMIMIAEYLIKCWKQREVKENIFRFFIHHMKQLVSYGVCFVPALIPMAYNWYNTGYINLTAADPAFTHATESVVERTLAYLFDLNHGILPYYMILLPLGIGFLVLAILRKKWLYLEWMLAFFVNIVLYSIMIHINCGMSGIARYNAWSAVLLIFSVGIFSRQLLSHKITQKIIIGVLAISIILSAKIVYEYGPVAANRTEYCKFTPIARYVLDNHPTWYNPLRSTFNSRTTNIDGGYIYNTPIVYTAADGYVRKILATKKDVDFLRTEYCSDNGHNDWFIKQLEQLTDEESYISIPRKYGVALYE